MRGVLKHARPSGYSPKGFIPFDYKDYNYMRQCNICRRFVESKLQTELCPHELKPDVRKAMQAKKKAFAQQVKAAQGLVGKQVWFSPLRDRIHTVQGCDAYGMLTVEGILGQVSAYWCVEAL